LNAQPPPVLLPAIFVSIASYRDPQLVPTIEDCLRKASYPERLRFGICWQHTPADPPLPFLRDPRLRILDVDSRHSRGACWARAEIMKLWQQEQWYLQIDSHCRFAPGWDERLIQMAAATGSPRPILTAYPAPFTPTHGAESETLADCALQVAFHAFTHDGIPELWPRPLPPAIQARPMRARFLAAGFLFAPGSFVREVPYDPELYFMGEEASMTVRAFTHGYDLFHPHETLLWHDYGRHDAPRHWGDHTADTPAPSTSPATSPSTLWSSLDQTSRRKIHRLLHGEAIQDFGLGTARTLEEYEHYAGLSFRERKAQTYPLSALEPPNPCAQSGWTDEVQNWIVKIVFPRAQLPAGALADPLHWFLGIRDAAGADVYQHRMLPAEIEPLQQEGEQLAIVCEFASETTPASWLLWPLSHASGWLPALEGRFAPGDVALLQPEESAKP